MPTYVVADQTALNNAVANATGGDRILLATGTYNLVSIQNRAFSTPLSISSQDPTKPAHVRELLINRSENVEISDLIAGRPLGTQPTGTLLNSVTNSKNVTVKSIRFQGSLDGDPTNDGVLMGISGSDNVRVLDSSFREGNRGLLVGDSTNIRVSRNSLQDLRTDGLNFADVQGVTIENNTIGGFKIVPGDHPDAIQFWTAGTTQASSDIVIRNNVVLAPSGSGNQGFFMHDEVGTLPFRNVTIENNLLYSNGGQWHGISVGNVHGLKLANNTVLSTPTDGMRYWIQVIGSRDAVVSDNVTDQILNTSNTNIQFINNRDLVGTPSFASTIPSLGAGPNAKVADLIVPVLGYQLESNPWTFAGKSSVANALGSSLQQALSGSIGSQGLGGLVANQSSTSLGWVELAPETPEPGLLFDAVSPAVAPEPLGIDQMVGRFGLDWHLNSFVALP